MPGRKRKTELQDAFSAIAGFRDLAFGTLEKLTGKPIGYWLGEYQHPQELPAGEKTAPVNSDMPLVDAYSILGLKPDAPLEDVKKHYRNLAALFHPDRGGYTEAMILLNRANEQIMREKGVR